MNTYKDDMLRVFQCNLPWNKLTGKNILITGSTGLIGGCIVELLMMNPNLDYHVYASGRNEKRAACRFNNYKSSPYFHFIKHDVTEYLQCDITFHYIIDAASNASPNYFINNPVEVIKANILGVSNLVEYGIRHGVERFLYVSTGEIYGEGDGRCFTEDYSGYINCLSPRACYPSSKRAAETLCVSYSAEYNTNVVIARPCHVYGPHFSDKDNRVYAQFIRNVLKGEDIVMKSSGSQFRSWCYVVDCVSAILHILLKGENREAYNIADENSNVTIKDLAEIIANIAKLNVIQDISKDQTPPTITKATFDTRKLKNLDWNITGTMKEKLRTTIQECRYAIDYQNT